MIWLYIILANLLVQIPNIIAIKYFGHSMTLKDAFKLASFTIPIGFFASTCFTLYFSRASELLSYPIMNLINIGVNVLVGFLVGFFVLKSTDGHWIDYIGVCFILSGVLMIIYKARILSFIGML
jgi:hypothetical protein